jgi:hypothetical protein
VLGYDKATELANEAYKSGKGILEIIRERKILTEPQIADLLDPVKLTQLDKNQYRTARNEASGDRLQADRSVNAEGGSNEPASEDSDDVRGSRLWRRASGSRTHRPRRPTS